MEVEYSSERLLVFTTPQHDATTQTTIVRNQLNAHYVEKKVQSTTVLLKNNI